MVGNAFQGHPEMPELCTVSATEHPAHHSPHKHLSLLQTLSHGPLEAVVRNESLSGRVCAQESSCRGGKAA